MNTRFEDRTKTKFSQKGAATLIVTVVLLALLTITVLTVTSMTTLELKTASNANREKEAIAYTQGGLDYGAMQYLKSQAAIAPISVSIPVSGGLPVTYAVTTSGSIATVVASGNSGDGLGSATVQEKYSTVTIGNIGEIPPLMAGGNIPLSGGFSIVANPNGGGEGVPVSAWGDSADIGGTANWSSCSMDEFLFSGTNSTQAKTTYNGATFCDTCECSKAEDNDLLCDAKDIGAGGSASACDDIVAGQNPDPFASLFGTEKEWTYYLENYEYSCSDIQNGVIDETDVWELMEDDKARLPLIWIDGACTVPSIGSPAQPVIVVVQDGDFTVNANTVGYGIFFSYDSADDGVDYKFKANGNAIIYGSLLVSKDADLPNGGFNLVYSPSVISGISNDGEGYTGVARFKGTWKDF